ncbi:MAG: hypothetical protein ACJAYU_001715 [Bradymonadia bacterium]|jgi:hypothetical protein
MAWSWALLRSRPLKHEAGLDLEGIRTAYHAVLAAGSPPRALVVSKRSESLDLEPSSRDGPHKKAGRFVEKRQRTRRRH